MFGSEVLDVALGLVFIFLITSLLATSIREILESVLKTRAIQLERGLRQLLDDPAGTGVTKELFDHPLLFGLFPGAYEPEKQLKTLLRAYPRRLLSGMPGRPRQALSDAPKRVKYFSNLPAYIPSRNFALALLDLVSRSASGGAGPLSLESVKAGAVALPSGRLRDAVLVAVGEAGNDLNRARASLEAWFDGTMDRVSGWYKRETQWILFAIGLFFAVVLNIDSLDLTRNLASNNMLRQQLVVAAEKEYPDLTTKTEKLHDIEKQAAGFSDAVGWKRFNDEVDAAYQSDTDGLTRRYPAGIPADQQPSRNAQWWRQFWRATVGWLLTGVAVSLGASFWFDLLSKIMVIRSTVKPYEKSLPEASADRGGAKLQEPTTPRQPPLPAQQAPVGQPDEGRLIPAAAVANIRLALDMADIDTNTVKLKCNDNEVSPLAVGNDLLAEVPLAVGTRNSIVFEGQDRTGQPVRWSQEIVPTLDDEGWAIAGRPGR